MKMLTDLNPRWFVLEDGGQRVGLTFECPCCGNERLGVYFMNVGEESTDTSYIRARNPNAGNIWTLSGPEDFALLTLSPSIDASHHGHWHGFITSGAVIGA